MENIEILQGIKKTIDEISSKYNFHPQSEDEMNQIIKDYTIDSINKYCDTYFTSHVTIDIESSTKGIVKLNFRPLDEKGEELILKIKQYQQSGLSFSIREINLEKEEIEK